MGVANVPFAPSNTPLRQWGFLNKAKMLIPRTKIMDLCIVYLIQVYYDVCITTRLNGRVIAHQQNSNRNLELFMRNYATISKCYNHTTAAYELRPTATISSELRLKFFWNHTNCVPIFFFFLYIPNASRIF
jgi:hypothetical protein